MGERLLVGLVLLCAACSGTAETGTSECKADPRCALPAPQHGIQVAAPPPAATAPQTAAPPVAQPAAALPSDPVPTIELKLAANDQAALDALEERVAPLHGATAMSLLDAHPLQLQAALGYDPRAAAGLDLIQATPLALSDAELVKLGEQGFAISPRHQFPNMPYGLKTIYAHDLPLYIALDPILDAVHNSYDEMLKNLESTALRQDLDLLLDGARRYNAEHTADSEIRSDLDVYFGVALSLLRTQPVTPSTSAIESLVKKARAADGIETVSLFGVPRDVDFSQFKPRGHYAADPLLSAYFKAIVWLGRSELRLIETLSDGSRVFNRRQLNAALAMRDAVSGDAFEAFTRIDAAITLFVGQHDYMQLHEIDALRTELGPDLATLSDLQIAQTIVDKGYGLQRIASRVMFKDPSTSEISLPLDRSFALLGQRYVVDSHVLSDVVYDRVPEAAGGARRFLPNPLDAAYAALGNSAALPMLRDELERYAYAPQLERARTLIDSFDETFWQENLYTLWMSALRALSPAADQAGLPSVARSERWSRRILNTQLASWAQLRHDTVAYAKSSYSVTPSCEFPDVYVDPYPEAFARLALFGKRGRALVSTIRNAQSAPIVDGIDKYFAELESVANILRDMAEQQKRGVPFNEAQLAFVNQAVKDSNELGCGGPPPVTGWYARLMYNTSEPGMEVAVADVHTEPSTPDRTGHVLHVATGLPRLMVVTVDTCNGPRAYAGVAFAYHEVTTENELRLDDAAWLMQAPSAADVPWLAPVLRP